MLPTVKLRWPLPSTETVAPSLIVICASPPLPTITYGVAALPPVEDTMIDEPAPDTVTVADRPLPPSPSLQAHCRRRRRLSVVGDDEASRPPVMFIVPLPPPLPWSVRPRPARPRRSRPWVFWPPTPATTSCEPAPLMLIVPVPPLRPTLTMTRPFGPVPDTVPPPVMFSVAVLPPAMSRW